VDRENVLNCKRPAARPGSNLPEERRRAERYPIEAHVTVRKQSGETIPATAANISSSGMLLRLAQPFPLRLGDEVTVEVALPDHPDKPLSAWGLGTVVRLDGLSSAVHLCAGSFHPLCPEPCPTEAEDPNCAGNR
jgi:hypothetical protein